MFYLVSFHLKVKAQNKLYVSFIQEGPKGQNTDETTYRKKSPQNQPAAATQHKVGGIQKTQPKKKDLAKFAKASTMYLLP